MFQPGKETNIPTSSSKGGIPMPDWTGKQVFSVDGVTITIGALILIVAAIWLWTMLAGKRR